MFFKFRNYESKLIHSIINFGIKNNLKLYRNYTSFIFLKKYRKISEWMCRKHYFIDGDNNKHYLQNLIDIYSNLTIGCEETSNILAKKYGLNSISDTVLYIANDNGLKYDGLIYTFKNTQFNECCRDSTAIYDIIVMNASYSYLSITGKWLGMIPMCRKKRDQKTTFIMPEFTRENPLMIPISMNWVGIVTDGYIVCKRIIFNRETNNKLNTKYSIQTFNNFCLIYTGYYFTVYTL